MNPLVSIIIPNYNHAAFLMQRLASVFNQTYQDFEVILLDDASTDHSVDILNAFSDSPKVSHYIINKENSGSPFKQWQKGIALAQGEFIWIAESDDYCETNFLETCLEVLNEDVGIAYVQSTDVNENGKQLLHRLVYTDCFEPNIWKADFSIHGLAFINDYLLVKNVIPNASAVVFRKALVKPEYFNSQLLHMRMCGDWFFWIQLVNGTHVTFVKKDLNYFRHHIQVSRNHHDVNRQKQRLIEEFKIRNYLEREFRMVNDMLDETLLIKWFKLHTKSDLLSREFYYVCNAFFHKFVLAYQFIRFKVK